MHLAFFRVKDKPAELDLMIRLQESPGIKLTVLRNFNERCDCDAYCVIGVKQHRLVKSLKQQGLPYFFWDKPYNRDWSEQWRVSYCSYQPVEWLMKFDFPDDRATVQGWLDFKPWKFTGNILFAGASLKYHIFHELPFPEAYFGLVQERLKGRKIIYRHRPSPVDENRKKLVPFQDLLEGARVLITHGSSACLDALRAGVPSIVLGDGVTAPISSRRLTAIDNPYMATDEERTTLLKSLAYFQWHKDEIRDGKLWPTMHLIMQNHTCEPTINVSSGFPAP